MLFGPMLHGLADRVTEENGRVKNFQSSQIWYWPPLTDRWGEESDSKPLQSSSAPWNVMNCEGGKGRCCPRYCFVFFPNYWLRGRHCPPDLCFIPCPWPWAGFFHARALHLTSVVSLQVYKQQLMYSYLLFRCNTKLENNSSVQARVCVCYSAASVCSHSKCSSKLRRGSNKLGFVGDSMASTRGGRRKPIEIAS